MISLKQYILESSIRKKYGVLLSQVNFTESTSDGLKKIPTVDKLNDMLKDALEQAVLRYKILRIKAVEEYNKYVDNKNAVDLKRYLAEKEADVIKHIQSHPGLLRRSKEKQKEYIDKKLEEFKKKFVPWKYVGNDFDTSTVYCKWHLDPEREDKVREYDNNQAKIDFIAKDVAKDIDDFRDDDIWRHLIGLDIVTLDEDLTSWRPFCHIVPMFDEETEEEFPKSVKRFYDYMSRMYELGYFSGD